MNVCDIDALIANQIFLVLVYYYACTITFTDIINAFVRKYSNSNDNNDHVIVENLREYNNSMQRILDHFNFGDATVDNCFPNCSSGFRNYNGFLIELKCHKMGHICYYISVPQENKYYAVNYNDLNSEINATFSGAGDNGMWKFGWDYATPEYISIPNIINFDSQIDKLKLLTVETIENDIQQKISFLNQQ